MGAVPSRVLHRRLAVLVAVLGVAAAFAQPAVADDGPVQLPAAAADAMALAEAVLTPETTAAPAEAATRGSAGGGPAGASRSRRGRHRAGCAPDRLGCPGTGSWKRILPRRRPPQTAAPSPEAPAAVTETPEPAPEAPVQAVETPATPVPTSIPAPLAEAVGAVAQQVQPINVNISLRYESPGDNGPVSQLNAAVADVAAAMSTAPAPATQYQTPESQYHAPSAPADSTPGPAAPSATENQAQPASEPTEQWDWTWQWSCGDAIPPEFAIPGSSMLPIWNWNWEWNCGGGPTSDGNSESQLPTQYHGAATQYQPININISIRILSPGNDGPVTQVNLAQTNVAVTVHAALPGTVVNPVPVTQPPSGGGTPQDSTPTTVSAPADSTTPCRPRDVRDRFGGRSCGDDFAAGRARGRGRVLRRDCGAPPGRRRRRPPPPGDRRNARHGGRSQCWPGSR